MTFKTRRREPQTNERAKQLRKNDNMAEALLWTELKDRQLGGFKFVRQLPIGPYYADFVCRSRKLVVELDGSQHFESAYDRRRDEYLRAKGYSVLRFWSHETARDMRSICETILATVEGELAEDVLTADMRFVFARGGGIA